MTSASGRGRSSTTFDLSAVWAVKDPRVSLTLPFWLPLVDESAAIVCLRSPRDVAASLHAARPRRSASRRAWTGVWLEYTRAALEHSAGLPVRQLFYDDWFADRAASCRPGRSARRARHAAVRLGGVTLVFFIVFFNVYQEVKEVSPPCLPTAECLA